MSKNNRRYLKKGLNPDYNVFVYFGSDSPNNWYVRIGGLETSRFPHGIALAQTFSTEQQAISYKNQVVEYFKLAFKINWKVEKNIKKPALNTLKKDSCLHDGIINRGHHHDQPSWCDQCGEDL